MYDTKKTHGKGWGHMNKEFLKKIFYQSLTGFLSLALAILLFCCIQSLDQLRRGFQWIMDILMPFIYGGTLAYLLKTPCNYLEGKFQTLLPEKGKRYANVLSVVTVLLLSLLVIYLLLSSVIPEMVDSIVALALMVPGRVEDLALWVVEHLEGNEELQSYASTMFTDMENWLRNWATTDLLPTVQGMMQGMMGMMGDVMTTVGSVLTVLKNVVLGLIICVYSLLSRRKFAKHGKALVYASLKPEWAEAALRELRFIDGTFVGFFGGKILDSAIVGVICYIFCAIMTATAGFQNAVLISVIIGVTNVIPYFGPFIGAVPAALLILISSPRNCLIFLIFILILQQFDGNVLGPKLLAGSVGLTSFWVLFSITLFQGLFGFVGILVGVPVFAVIYDLLRRWIVRGLKKHGKLDVLQ